MTLGIVGHAAEKFTPLSEAAARRNIRRVIKQYKPELVVSGASPMGGIDRWAIEEAQKLGIAIKELPPCVDRWDGTSACPGFKQRNMQIAASSDVVVSLVIANYPIDFKGRKFSFCYHHTDQVHPGPGHVKSGGCWTAKYARSIGKVGVTEIIT